MTMLEDAKKQLAKALKYADIDEETWERLQFPKITTEASIPMRHDSGTLKIYRGIACIYDDILGPGKGGIRFHQSVSRDEIQTLSFLMNFKCAALRLPFSGAKGGICIDSTKLSHRELERLSKAYVVAFSDVMGPDRWIGSPDLYTNSMIMGWFFSEYRKIKGGDPRDVVTGKPPSLGGLPQRSSSTGYGAYYVLDYLIKNYKPFSKSNITIAIAGFGQVGYWFAEMCYKMGLKIVALSNIDGGTYDQNGLDVIGCRKSLDADNTWGQGTPITTAELLELPVTIVCPAAIEHMINKDNMHKIKAEIILELANNPLTLEADEFLTHNNKITIPDILINSGGVVMSYFEWLVSRSADIRDEERVQTDLKKMIEYATNKVLDRVNMHNIPFRTATYALALKRISDAQKSLGTSSYFKA